MATKSNSMRLFAISLMSTAPLLTHAPDGANPTHPITRAISKISSKKSKTEEEKAMRNELSYLSSLYHDDKEFFLPMIQNASFDEDCIMEFSKDPLIEESVKIRIEQAKIDWPGHCSFPYVPAQNIEAMIRDGATAVKKGKAVQVACSVIGQSIPLIYNGPKDIKSLMSTHTFRDVQSGKVPPKTGPRVLIVRPRFNRWFLFFKLLINTSVVEVDVIREAIVFAGEQKCLGDQRPRYGRFEVFDMTEIPGDLKTGAFYEEDPSIGKNAEERLMNFIRSELKLPKDAII